MNRMGARGGPRKRCPLVRGSGGGRGWRVRGSPRSRGGRGQGRLCRWRRRPALRWREFWSLRSYQFANDVTAGEKTDEQAVPNHGDALDVLVGHGRRDIGQGLIRGNAEHLARHHVTDRATRRLGGGRAAGVAALEVAAEEI